MNKLNQLLQVWKNMGTRYLLFRLRYETQRRTGKLQKRFPVQAMELSFPPLDQWRTSSTRFFFEGRDGILMAREEREVLKKKVERLLRGEIQFFSYQWKTVNDWHTHPVTGHVYPKHVHWSKIEDIDPVVGDIKYVWERARFTFLLDMIRYDFHSGENHGEWVMQQMLSWIEENPINQGPHYRCSQEISLRVMHWIFALNFYKYSLCLTEERWQRIHNSIYRQMEHVFENIEFSRIAVRNNHAITECLGLYLVGLLFPFYPEAKKWKVLGKRWLQEEVAYQVYPDGTYLQFSMNYHRVALQLLCWGIRLSELNQEKLDEVVYDRAKKSMHFLYTCQDRKSGWLPNYGNNDGAWFFPLSDSDFRDYRPLLNTSSMVLYKRNLYPESDLWSEDAAWYGFDIRRRERNHSSSERSVTESFPSGGYYVYNDGEVLTFLRCGAYKDRPAQADNLHVDVWCSGQNLLRDAGSFLYNTTEETIRYFAGTRGHNTVMLGDHDQMLKGPRFIWWHWPRWKKALLKETEEQVIMEGSVPVFAQVGKNIIHRRKITYLKSQKVWEIEDELLHKPHHLPMQQWWHPSEEGWKQLVWKVVDEKGEPVQAQTEEGWNSSYYGAKEKAKDMVFSTYGSKLLTRIELRQV